MFRVLAEIREGIAELATPDIAANIREIVDIDHIKAQLQSNAYDWTSRTATITGIFNVAKQVQAPKLNAQIRVMFEAVTAKMHFALALRKLLSIVNLMRVDAANARLRLIAPVIKDLESTTSATNSMKVYATL